MARLPTGEEEDVADFLRQAHLDGEVAKALGQYTGELFEAPTIEPVEILAEKAPD